MYKIVFSATGRTMKVADAVCAQWENTEFIDLSLNRFEDVQLTADDLCAIAVPVYGGCVPRPAVENLKRIQANGAKAVLVAVYGNRAYDGALAQLKDISQKAGFIPVAAIAALAQHSLITQVAATRPDENDKAQLSGWGKQIMDMYRAGTLPADVHVPGIAPEKPHSLPVHPKADKNCTFCGLCAEKCPVSAIPADKPSSTDNTRCITCMRCVEICPAHARSLMPGVMKVAGPIMKKVWGRHTANEFFID